MPRIPQNYLHELIDRVDIVEVVSRSLDLKRTGDNYSGLCPFHQEKTPSFTVSIKKQFYHCFGCGAHGNVIDFLMQSEGLDFVEAVFLLADLFGIPAPYDDDVSDDKLYFDLLSHVSQFYQKSLKNAPKLVQDYLAMRGISNESVERFGLGFSPNLWNFLLKEGGFLNQKQLLIDLGLLIEGQKGLFDRFRNRLMFPIQGRNQNILGFGGRVFDDSVPKYMNSSESKVFQKSNLLYGMSHLPGKDLSYVVLTEGYMDVLMLHQYGFRHVLASLGTSVGLSHLSMLKRLTNRIVFCFDSDPAGFKAVIRVLKVILEGKWKDLMQYEFLLLPKGEDPDSLLKKEGLKGWECAIEKTRSYLDVLVSYVTKKDQLIFSTQDKLLSLKRASDLLSKNTDRRFLELLVQLFSEKLRWQPDLVKAHLTNEASSDMGKTILNQKIDRATDFKRSNSMVLLIDRLISMLFYEPKLIDIYNQKKGLFNFSKFNVLNRLTVLINALPEKHRNSQGLLLEITNNELLKKKQDSIQRLYHVYLKMGELDLKVEFENSLEKFMEQSCQSRLSELKSKMLQGFLSDDEKDEMNQLFQNVIASKKNL